MRMDLFDLIERTPIADTHEHITEEPNRLIGGDGWRLKDIGLIFSHYIDSDLISSGMPVPEFLEVLKADTPADRKWMLVKPWWEKAKHTGYGMCVRESVRALFGEEDVTDSNWQSLNDKLAAQIEPGYF